MTEEPTRPLPQSQWWQPQPQAPGGPPPPAGQPPAPQEQPTWQSPAPQVPPPPAWQQPGPQDPPPPQWQAQGPYGPVPASPLIRRRRKRWPWITLLVIVIILVAGDRVALVLTENAMASNFQSSVGLSGKPKVTIDGIPFLTQLAARDFKTVHVNATDETTGPLEIASLTATLHGMHIRSLNSATIDQFNASALVTFTALANAGGIPQGITLSQAGPNTIQVNVNIGPINDTATATVTRVGTNMVNIRIDPGDFGGIPASVLGNMADFTISLPKLPAGVSIQSVSITQRGLMIVVSGVNTTLSQNP